jgi:hypothetical protein
VNLRNFASGDIPRIVSLLALFRLVDLTSCGEAAG